MTEEQQEAIDLISANKSLIIEACAGSGKTTTLVKGIGDSRRNNDNTLVLTFNKAMKEELVDKLDDSMEVLTIDSMAYKVWANTIGKPYMDFSQSPYDLFEEQFAEVDDRSELTLQVERALSGMDYTDSHLVDPILEKIRTLAFNGKFPRGWLSAMAFMCATNDTRFGMYFGRNIVLDEVQDTSITQLEFIRRSHPKQVVAVGDRYQNIYEWRGASTDGMDILQSTYNLQTHKLSYSFRCARRIAHKARKYHPFIQPTPYANEGIVGKANALIDDATFIARKNSSLMEIALQRISEGKGFVWRKNLVINDLKRISRSASPMLQAKNDLARAKESENERRAELLNAVIKAIESGVSIKTILDEMFQQRSDFILGTPHAVKGMGFDKVILHSDLFQRKGDEEDRLRYVAITRAKNELYYYEGEKNE